MNLIQQLQPSADTRPRLSAHSEIRERDSHSEGPTTWHTVPPVWGDCRGCRDRPRQAADRPRGHSLYGALAPLSSLKEAEGQSPVQQSPVLRFHPLELRT